MTNKMTNKRRGWKDGERGGKMEKGVEEWCVSWRNNLEGCGREWAAARQGRAGPRGRRGRRTEGTEDGGDGGPEDGGTQGVGK